MTDRELLEKAAKAAGFELPYFVPYGVDDWVREWNPLTDDGDALRLAVELRIDVAHNSFGNVIADYYALPGSACVVLPHGDDPMAATRRAIVMMAAKRAEG